MTTCTSSPSTPGPKAPGFAIAVVAMMSLAGLSASVCAQDEKSKSQGCVDLREAPAISLPADKIKWQTYSAIPGGKTGTKNVAPMTAYLEGSIASEAVRIQLFSFPAGIASVPHMHPQAERGYVLEGALNVVVGDGTNKDAIRYPAGSYYTVPARTRHYSFSTEGTKVLSIMGGPYEVIPIPQGNSAQSKK
jgi:quercetin dioxygenase-like cupin family protein